MTFEAAVGKYDIIGRKVRIGPADRRRGMRAIILQANNEGSGENVP